ncbi:MAG: hypothetical protein IPO68_15715 [Chitinophagaceae bacterium]|nr:hypothetical protein [Chitinophagaceae bacterium]
MDSAGYILRHSAFITIVGVDTGTALAPDFSGCRLKNRIYQIKKPIIWIGCGEMWWQVGLIAGGTSTDLLPVLLIPSN